MNAMKELTTNDLYNDIWDYVELRLYTDYRWADSNYFDFKNIISLEEVNEQFQDKRFSKNEIENCYLAIEDIFIDDKERAYCVE
jgi:hypothetical protein